MRVHSFCVSTVNLANILNQAWQKQKQIKGEKENRKENPKEKANARIRVAKAKMVTKVKTIGKEARVKRRARTREERGSSIKVTTEAKVVISLKHLPLPKPIQPS